MGRLYLVATPLGNLEDITLRALRILREVALIATEDTRTTGKLLRHFDIQNSLMSYHEYSGPAQIARIIETLNHRDVALVSDAGTPLLSDPGYKLVQAALDHQVEVISIPGPSALLTALPVSGLPMHQFLFLGFVPRKSGHRRQFLEKIKDQATTLVCYESPHRLVNTLADLVAILGPARQIALCRELTKLHEEIWRGTIEQAHQVWSAREIRGEFTLVIEGVNESLSWSESQVSATLSEVMSRGMSTRDAVRQVVKESGWLKRDVYTLAEKIKNHIKV